MGEFKTVRACLSVKTSENYRGRKYYTIDYERLHYMDAVNLNGSTPL